MTPSELYDCIKAKYPIHEVGCVCCVESTNLCVLLANDKDLFAHMPVVFLLVTDIDVKKHGAVALADMLNKLGGNSSDIYSQCVSKSQKTLDSDIHIEHQYVYCREFDDAISVL